MIFSSLFFTKARSWQLLGLFLFSYFLIVIVNYQYYFKSPLYEYSDYAANALQIQNAKNIDLLHGNYSRWGFYHPGPIFFYMYALGEILLYDSHIVPTPFNAHLLTGLFIQMAFLAIAVFVLEKASHHLLAAPMSFLVSIFFFSLFPRALWDIWPPYTLITPFLFFLTSTLYYIDNKKEGFLSLFISVSFLLHLHVSMWLFCLPVLLFLLAKNFHFLLQSRKLSISGVLHYKYRGISLLFSIIFFMPFLLDLQKGTTSNLLKIFNFFLQTNRPHHLPTDVFFYLLSYLHFEKEIEFLPSPCTLSCASSFLSKIPYYVPYLLLAFFLIYLLRKSTLNKLKQKTIKNTQFLIASFKLISTISVLIAIWTLRQNGPLYFFNTSFFYSVLLLSVFLLLVPLYIFTDDLIKKTSILSVYVVCLVVIVVYPSTYRLNQIEKQEMISTLYKNIILSNRNYPEYIHTILIKHEYWPEEITLFTALVRNKKDVYYIPTVDFNHYPSLSYVFDKRILNHEIITESNNRIVIWEFVKTGFPNSIQITDTISLTNRLLTENDLMHLK